ncbi:MULTISPECIES: PAS domain-containing sensor histidine kinase [unclassified Marinobacterium]|uniref:PAS domain-containing sensor histidine kinase n=1 Tax=unclassified Marinobacterium TaxID=2644139 RepID=UPI00156A54AC|nr:MULTISPECIES: PAS domain-containing sensor histidine kinase [unclassified Marinobacterium]NRP10164.1 Sensor protein EvgS precursor [Marinobacterium sp. xm-g-48]NRP83263.1 Sensor protein EvgS precursor [Marinobacterium sp. xm-d-509]
MVTQQEIFEKLALKAAFLMALLSLPSLALSLYGALIDDAAFVPVMVQTLLVLSLILAAIPAVPMGYKQRLLVTVIVLFIAGAVATLRYANPTIGYTYTIIISLIVALMLNRLGGYLALAAMNILVGVVAVLLFDLTPIRVALQFVTFTGTTAIGLEIIFTLIQYHSQQGEVLAEEMERQQVVSSEADIGFMEFDYELGQLDGDATIQSRFGRTVGDGPFPLDDYAHLFPTWSWKVSQSMIAEFSQKSVGTVVNFTNAMTGLLDGKEYHYRITGVNMMREGRLKFVGVSINITEEKNALEKAKDLGGQIELVSGAGGVGLIEIFPDTHTFKCNPEVSKRLAVEHSESERDLELFYAHQTEELRAQFLTQRQALVGSPDGELQVFVHPFYFANGDLHYMRVSRIKREVNGRASFLGLSLDITDEVQAKEQAEKQAEQLNLLAMSGEVAYFEVDLERGLIDGNALLKQRAGLPADAPAFPMAEIVSSIPVESRAEFEANVQRAIEVGLGGVTTFEHPYYKHDGELIYVRITATTQMLRGRLHALGASVEITEAVRARQQAEKQAEQLKLTTEQGKIGLYEFDLEKGVMHANSVLCERFGVDPELGEISQEVMLDNLAEESRASTLEHIERGKTAPEGYFATSTVDHIFSDGSVHKIRIFEKLERRQGRPFYVGASVDVTDEVEAREQAEAAMSKLAQQQDRQAQMYAVIGHELRTPAASLQMMLDDLEEGETLDNALVGSNIEHLLGVIDTLRAVAQPERMAQAAFKDVVIDEILTAQVANLSGLAERSGVELTANLSSLTSDSVHIQSSLLRQVTANLIKNAIIHSGGDKVHLHASSELKGDHTRALTIRISDNGKGIADSKIDTLFEAYQRGDTNAEGTGLGLFVCKEIVSLMGGDLHYETSEQGGAEFVIELVVKLSKQTSETPEPIDNPLEGKRVLMAEDNNVIQMLTAKMLKKQGASVVVNSDGQQALEAYAEGAFDLVLSDIFMPELDGYGLVKGLRERGYTGPIVGLTAATIGAETDLMLEAGADIVISKPIELAKLQAFLIEYDK